MAASELHDAVTRGEFALVEDLLRRKPEIVNQTHSDTGELLALHIAVLRRDAPMTRLLMEHGADARSGIWPYRKATEAHTIASERGYAEIVSIIEEIEQQRPTPPPEVDEVALAIERGDVDWLRARHAAGQLTNAPLRLAVKYHRPEILALLLELGVDPDDSGALAHCAESGKLAMAEMLLAHGADANGWACGWNAYRQKDEAMIALLAQHGGVPNAATPGYLRDTELAARMFAQEDTGSLPKGTVREGRTVVDEVLDPAASAGATDILRMALARIDWPRDDPRWFGILSSPLCFWNHIPWIYSEKWDLDRSTYLECFAMVLERSHANLCGRFGMTILHYAAASYDWITPKERIEFVRMLLDRGAKLDVRDQLLASTPLAWACRWGRLEVVELLLARGADPRELDAEPWATPLAWAGKMGHTGILAVLQEHARE